MIDVGVEMNVDDEVYKVTIRDSEYLGPDLGSPKHVNVTGAVPVGPSMPGLSATQRMPTPGGGGWKRCGDSPHSGAHPQFQG